MTRQLTISSDEVVETAERLARRHGVSTTEVVVRALRRFAADIEPPGTGGAEPLTPEQRDTFDALQRLSSETARRIVPGARSDHDDLYDDSGLPH